MNINNLIRILLLKGLDAAGPGFTVPIVVSPADRLDPTDAKYVQCLHTSWMGTGDICGHANFDANDGVNQPPCISPLCHHSRAAEIFIYSLNPLFKFRAVMCYEAQSGMGGSGGLLGALTGTVTGVVTSISSFILPMQPSCTPVATELYGIYASKLLHGKFQFSTTDHPPYALGF